MEIHELNTFSGTPGANDYLATDNGNDTSKISIKSITDPLNARIDNIIAGPASSAEEVVDARLGEDGVTYDSLGDAIRDQIKNIKNDINGVVLNYKTFNLIPDSYVVRSNGSFETYEGWSRTDFIEIDPKETLWIESQARSVYNACYDENQAFIRAFAFEAGTFHAEVPANTKYVVLSGENTVFPLRVYTKIEKLYQNAFDELVKVDASFGVMPLTGWSMGSINSSGDLEHSWNRITSDFIPISGGTTLYADFTNAGYGFTIAEYDASKNFIRQKPEYFYPDNARYWTVSPNAAYIRCTAASRSNLNLTPDNAASFGMSLKAVPLSPISRIKIMTYNMGHYNYGIGIGLPPSIYDEKLLNYRRFFGDEAPEIIGIQEYDTRMDEANTIWSNDVLWNYLYPYEARTGSWTALKSKKPLLDGKNDTLSTGRYYTEGWVGSVYILSVHLSVGENNTQKRLDEAREIATNLLANKERFIMFGDFNPEPGEEEELYQIFTNEGYNIANCGYFGKYYTWSNNRADFDDYDNPQGTKLYYLDNIITSANIKIANVYPIPSAYNKLSSDHIPLVAELEL